MVTIEQLVYGIDPGSESAGRKLLGMSPGMSREVAAEIQRYCDGWGQAPTLGLQHPALISFPLEQTMPSLRGRLYAVIRVGQGTSPVFHAAVLSEAGYAEYEYNPFTLSGSGFFAQHWEPGTALARRQLTRQELPAPLQLSVSTEDVGLVDEALHKLMAEGSLILPIEQGVGQSDRTLALILAVLPPTLRKIQRFATFTTSEFNHYTLAARETEGSSCAGWKRWFMAQPDSPLDAQRAAYVRAVRDSLIAGNLAVLVEAARKLDAGESLSSPTGRGHSPDLVPTSAAMDLGAGSSSRRTVETRALATSAAGPRETLRPTVSATTRPTVRTGTGGTADPKPRSRKPGRTKLVRQPVRIAQVGRRTLPSSIAMTIVFAVAGLAAFLWLSHGGQDGGFGWAVLKDRFASAGTPRAATLLEVVNVGETYDRLIRKVARSGLGGLVDARSRDRHEALAVLQVEAAAPLLQQGEFFLKLAGDGIQQGHRPDRESKRLESLDDQGEVLLQELSRLEMAWYSLASGTDWRDLGKLSDSSVTARRDSLLAEAPQALDQAADELGTAVVRRDLTNARRQVGAMQSLLSLFQEPQWSQAWEDRLYQSAERISPTASGITRSYRNAAFVLVRLKKAERLASHRELPFAADLSSAQWPSPEVRDILPALRKQTLGFSGGDAPALLVGTNRLYAYLGQPAEMAKELNSSPLFLEKLESNPAYKFDRAAYADYLNRVRFEVTGGLLARSTEPDQIPDSYFVDPERNADTAFRAALGDPQDPRAWDELADQEGPGFFTRWARKESEWARASLKLRQGDFDSDYRECVGLLHELSTRAAAGEDWSATWLDLRERAARCGDLPPASSLSDLVREHRRERLSRLVEELDQPRLLPVSAVTVRLDQAVGEGLTDVSLRFRVLPDGPELTSAPIQLGPAAPAGSGWVGTGSLDWAPQVGPDSRFEAEVVDTAGNRILVQVAWEALTERNGPGALVRPREDESGSIKFQLGTTWWSELQTTKLE